MTDRPPPPSPAQFASLWRADRLDRPAAIRDMARAGLICGTLLGPAASRRGPGLPDYARRPLLPVTAAEEAAWLDEARRQLGPEIVAERPGRDGGTVSVGYDGTEYRTPELQNGWTTPDGRVHTKGGRQVFTLPPDYRREILPAYRGAVHMCMDILNP